MEKEKFKYLDVFLIAALTGVFILAYFPVWKSLLTTWYKSDQNSHGFLIIPICIYILWQKKKELMNTLVTPSIWGLILVIFSLLLYIFAHFAGIATVRSLSMILLLGGTVIYLYGFIMFKQLLFPLFFLLFMIPIPQQIYSSLTIPLQLFVTKTSSVIAEYLGITIYCEGNIVNLPNHTLQVVDACSGMRSLVSLLAISVILGYFTLKSDFLKTILFFLGIPTAIVVNIIRVEFMIVAFYYFNIDLTSGNIHTIFGLTIYVLALFLLIIIKGVLSYWDSPYIRN